MNKLGRLTAVILVLSLAAASLTGCGAGGSTPAEGSAFSPQESSEPQTYATQVPRSEDTSGEEELTRILAKKAQETEPGDSEIHLTAEDLVPQNKDYTVLIYMTGSNLESHYGSASKDILEMQKAAVDFTRTNLILFTGGSVRWNTNVPCTTNNVIDVSRGTEDWVVAQTEGNADMGSSYTLSAFLNFACEYYPADHYALIFWDHGAGPVWGYGSDELFGNDSLLLGEMKSAMENSPFDRNRKLDFVGFDACLMGNLECMNMWADYAEYYVGSEELEPGDGWDYTFLSAFNETFDPLVITGQIIDSYAAYYEDRRSDTFNPALTLACADLSRLGRVHTALSALSSNLGKTFNDQTFTDLAQSRASVLGMGVTRNADGEEGYSYDLADAGSLADAFAVLDPVNASALHASIDDCIVTSTTNLEDCSCVSLYFPARNKAQYRSMWSLLDLYSFNQEYSNLVSSYAGRWMKEGGEEMDLAAPELTENEILLPLTEDQADVITDAYYSILSARGDGTYSRFLSDCAINPDEEGVLHIPSDPVLFGFEAEDGTFSSVPVRQVSTGRSRDTYATGIINLMTDYNLTDGYCDSQRVDISFSMPHDGGNATIQNITGVSAGDPNGDRSTISISDYSYLQISYQDGRYPTVSDRGSILPYSDWNSSGTITWSTRMIDSTFRISSRPISQLKGDYICQIVLETATGERQGSDIIALTPERDYTSTIVMTKNGGMSVLLYEDHAEITAYEGSDETIKIPEQVEGLPVTVIARSAFSKLFLFDPSGFIPVKKVILPDTIQSIESEAFFNCLNLTDINLPDGLTSLGNMAFGKCRSLEEIDLPSSLTAIGTGAFMECRSLRRIALPANLTYLGESPFECCYSLSDITVPASCRACIFRDGVLYSSDGKVVIGSAAGSDRTEYTIQEGTERIAYGAFLGNKNIKTVHFPESLTVIGNAAFYGCNGLDVPHFPAALAKIGSYAFSGSHNKSDPWPDTAQVIHIGPNLLSIGTTPFSVFRERIYEVDPANPYYSAVDGCLTTKARDTILDLRNDRRDIITVPDGITVLDIGLLGFASRYYFIDPYEVYIPDTVKIILNPDTYICGSYGLFHCSRDSRAYEWVMSQDDYNWSSVTEPVRGTAETAVEGGTLTFELHDTFAALISYQGEDLPLTVPDTAEGLPVTVIGNGVDSILESGICEITLPDSVRTLNDHALEFNFYFGDVKLSLPASLEVIGNESISYSAEIEDLPDSVSYIGSDVFGRKCFANGFRLPSALDYLSPDAFDSTPYFRENENCSAYSVRDGVLYTADGTTLLLYPDSEAEAVIPENVTGIGEYAFASNTLLTSVSFPGSVRTIGSHAFNYCNSLTEINFSEGLNTIADYAFSYCSALTELSFPASLESIGQGAFLSCEELERVEFAEGLKLIDDRAFSDDPALLHFRLPDSLIRIGRQVFDDEYRGRHPDKIGALYIGAGLEQIGDSAFGTLPADSFEVSPSNRYYKSVDGFLTDASGGIFLICPPGRSGKVTVPDGIQRVEGWSFYDALNVTDIYIPESVTSIGAVLFRSSYYKDGESVENKVTIHCKKDSEAMRWAVDNWVDYKLY